MKTSPESHKGTFLTDYKIKQREKKEVHFDAASPKRVHPIQHQVEEFEIPRNENEEVTNREFQKVNFQNFRFKYLIAERLFV